MITYIKSVQADIILLQDFGDYLNKQNYFSNVETLRDSLGYKFVYTSNDFVDLHSYGGVIQGCAIFSKIPFLNTGKVIYKDIAEPESICYADIEFANKKLRFYTTHLVSMNIHPHTGVSKEQGEKKYGRVYRYSKKVTRTIKQYDQLHVKEAEFIKQLLSKNQYPSVITGDFNSVPSSYVYHTIKGNRQDAFIKKGFGLGHSYSALSKTLRIDYVLVDTQLKILQVITPQLYLSDHFPVITDIAWVR
jgi:endonuclease/exonuclease/phosphatase family metal-dependent hydrolase